MGEVKLKPFVLPKDAVIAPLSKEEQEKVDKFYMQIKCATARMLRRICNLKY